MFDPDDEIVQDFLVEANELLEQLSEQLVQLEQQPTDKELLNAVFRGFHTIKGGSSFLKLDELVEVCHIAEDVFNDLRKGERIADSCLMDYVLKVLDFLKEQFQYLSNGQSLTHADPELIDALRGFAEGKNDSSENSGANNTAGKSEQPKPDKQAKLKQANQKSVLDESSISADDYERLLDAAEDNKSREIISSEELDNPIDKIKKSDDSKQDQDSHLKVEQVAEQQEQLADSDEVDTGANVKITDEEFEVLLDEIHGKGMHCAAPMKFTPISEQDTTPIAGQTALKTQVKTETAVKDSRVNVARTVGKDHSIQGETTVRVDTKRLDDIMNMVGELVLARNRLVTLETNLSKDDEVTKAVANLDLVTANLQTAVMKTRMQPIRKVFGRFPRVVRDLARALKKEVTLELHGEDTDLDKNLVEALADPLVHLVRNSVDHGIEMPDARAKVGKPGSGTISLAAEQEGDHILLSIDDDGAGIDPEILRYQAVARGIMEAEAAARLDEKECFNLIFLPGFSTKTQTTDISGRGVGMDVVKTRISQLNGSIDVESKPGKGTRIVIRVPLTLAIMPTLMVMLGDQTFALPLVSVSEIFNLDLGSTNTIDGQLVIMVREKAMPIFFLRNWLIGDFSRGEEQKGHVVVVHVGTQKVGFVVDNLIGQEEVVIKPLGELLHGTPGLAGATITGDGRIALILDVPGLMKSYVKKTSYVS